jgi:drug/metabolite transporter (DMT)-like permease
VALQGLLLFCLNYLFVYYGSESLPSGVVAVLFTALLFANIVNERFFFSAPVSARVVLGAVCGVTGIALVFWPEISQLTLGDEAVAGAALVVAGALTASLGNMAAIRNTRTGAQVITLNAWAMAWGTAILVAAALVRGEPPAFEWTTAYVGSLLFLALPGTAIAFGFYLALIRRIGASRAAYSNVLLPVVALGLSTVFEGYRWTLLAAAGVALTLVGNAIALSRRPAAPARG